MYKHTGIHYVIAKTEEEAAANLLSYPGTITDRISRESAQRRLDNLREAFGDEYDIFIVVADIEVKFRGSELLDAEDEAELLEE